MWEAAHRADPGSELTVVTFESTDSQEALAHFRALVPEGERLMYYRATGD
jgi:hypothetical protein